MFVFFCTTSLGCGPDKPKPAVPVGPVDEWANLPKSAQWLHAVGDFTGTKKEECAEATKWVTGESECQAGACEDAEELTKDWLSRCPSFAPGDVDKVKELLAKYHERAAQPDPPCRAQLKPMLEGKCGEDATCEGPAQKWVTRCAGPMGSPLAVHKLVTFVQRMVKDHDVELDTRSCSALRDEAVSGVTCGDRFKCEDAIAKIDVFRARCEEEGDRPTVAFALAEMTIQAAAERKVEPIMAIADDEGSAAIRAKLSPLVADGTGLVVSVCGQRVSSFETYTAARKECDPAAMITFARAFKVGSAFEVRMGQVAPADPATFAMRYPSLLLPGERDLLDKERIATFNAALAAAEKLAADQRTASEGLKKLEQLLRERGHEVFRSEAMRAALTAKDASFVQAFRELGREKAKAKGPRKELAAIAIRGDKHAFADVDDDGSVRFGAVSWAVLFDTSALFPLSHAAYLTSMRPLVTLTAKNRPSEEPDADEARAFGALAEDCAAGPGKVKAAEQALLECAFGVQTCDAAKVTADQNAILAARKAAENAFVTTSIFAMSAVGKANDYYRKIMTTAQCEPPPW